ncbi:MAG TPA: 4'-phosphopantetheinyl transferase superfamily protein [Solirubrobacterales bacterium]|nr:4'-phosphopantetheinyl transferase superfamily protein [Solirubrobacterales bacterium]
MSGERKSPAAGEVHVWRVELPAEDRRGAARRALAAILAAHLGGAAEAELGVDENGKPRLARAPGRLSFNLSHSGGLALVAIAPGGVEVGVDVERLRPRRDPVRLAARWLPAADAAAVASAPEAEREWVFHAAWTRHEARVKCAGTGLAGRAPGREVVAWQLPIDAGYAAAVALDYGCVRPCVIWTNARQEGFALKPLPDLKKPTESQNAHDSGRSFQENQ